MEQARGEISKEAPPMAVNHAAKRILIEVAWALAWIPLLTVASVLFFLLPLIIPAIAEVNRSGVRKVGGKAPSEITLRPARIWYSQRIFTPQFWHSDLPLAIGSGVLGFVSWLVLVTGMSLALVLFALPLLVQVTPEVRFFYWELTSPWHGLWSIPLAVLSALAVAGLLLVGSRLRQKLTEVVSTVNPEQQIVELTQQLDSLNRGRNVLVDSFATERARIERDLHDGVQQHLVALSMQLGAAQQMLARVDGRVEDTAKDGVLVPSQQRPDSPEGVTIAQAREHLHQAQDQVEITLRALREVVRGIHPTVLDELGLVAAVEELCGSCGLEVQVSTQVASGVEVSEIPIRVSSAIYLAIAECLTNVAKHSGVQQARVELGISPSQITVQVADRGRGGAQSDGGSGLCGLAERLAVVGGNLQVASPTGGGTRVSIGAPTSIST